MNPPRAAVERTPAGDPAPKAWGETGTVPPAIEYAALDLETTGLDPARDRVIEVGAVAFTTEQVTSTLEQLVDPGRAVPDTVLRLTGIKPEELRGAANAERAVLHLLGAPAFRPPLGMLMPGGVHGRLSWRRHPSRCLLGKGTAVDSGAATRQVSPRFQRDHSARLR